ncbi:Os11g0525900 [Oryza sativa Japonica Group]|uniref:Os11g0525900 protein n=1 Tax=Oryza sativa subsp. japonica TaxID=39947 RepID=A0A0P0Y2S5_ORYSJ|nr:hypothetical protein EE612_055856 [Oryza sativa]BAT14244.1 Os11g0525900 [Oryza sativa Japonica Group]
MNTAAARGGDGVAGVQLQEFAYFVVIDLEATCERGRRIYPQEIIEFASVVVDGATGEQLAEAFRAYVRPLHHRELTDYCRELTGIAQADVDAGVDLREALRAHDAWLDARGVKNAAGGGGGGGGFAVVTWGDWDCRTMLEGECRFKGIIGDGKPEYFDRWINLKCGVASRVGVARRPGPTQGRRFFGCGRWTPARGAVCSYFVWEDVDMSRANPRP